VKEKSHKLENRPLDGFGLENFRVFKNKQFFDFKPVTIITGANSSGKSSVIKGLKLLKSNMPAFRWDLSLPNHLQIYEDSFGHYLGNLKQCLNTDHKGEEILCFAIPVSLKMVDTKFIACFLYKPQRGDEENQFTLQELSIYNYNDFHKKEPIVRLDVGRKIQVDFSAFKQLLEDDFLKNLHRLFGKLYHYNKNYTPVKKAKKDPSEMSEEELLVADYHEYFERTSPKLYSDSSDPELSAGHDALSNDEEFDFFFRKDYFQYGYNSQLYEQLYLQSIEGMTIYGINSINYFDKKTFRAQPLHERVFQWFQDYDAQKPILPFHGLISGKITLNRNHKYFKKNPQKILEFQEDFESHAHTIRQKLKIQNTDDQDAKIYQYFCRLENKHFAEIKHLWFPYQISFNNQPIQNEIRYWDGLVSENKDDSEFDFEFWTTPKETRTRLEEDKDFGKYYKLQCHHFFVKRKESVHYRETYHNYDIFIGFIEQCIEKWIVQAKHKMNNVVFVTHISEVPTRVYSLTSDKATYKILAKYQNVRDLGVKYKKIVIKKFSEEMTNNEFLVKHLKTLGIAEDFIIESSEGGAVLQPFFIVKNEKRSIADTGYGYMKVLLLLLDIVNADRNSTIIVEEPEANLHPDFQSKLADIFIDAHKIFGHHFIIETHSEYLIRKLQYLTAKGDFNKDDSVIYYLNHPKSKNCKQVNTVKIRLDGRLDGDFGHGFFDEASNLITDLFRLSEDN
jgi:hypothetical protein